MLIARLGGGSSFATQQHAAGSFGNSIHQLFTGIFGQARGHVHRGLAAQDKAVGAGVLDIKDCRFVLPRPKPRSATDIMSTCNVRSHRSSPIAECAGRRLLGQIAPTARAHINMRGIFTFDTRKTCSGPQQAGPREGRPKAQKAAP
jgi:hypothetical protein